MMFGERDLAAAWWSVAAAGSTLLVIAALLLYFGGRPVWGGLGWHKAGLIPLAVLAGFLAFFAPFALTSGNMMRMETAQRASESFRALHREQ